MKGTAKVRVQGAAEPILGRMLKERGLDEPPLWKHRPPETRARMARWRALGEVRDGPINPNRVEIPDVEAATATLKQMAYDRRQRRRLRQADPDHDRRGDRTGA